MNHITNSEIKTVKSLGTVKGRREHGCFVVERTKIVLEMLAGRFALKRLIATAKWYEEHRGTVADDSLCVQASPAQMERMSSLSTAPDVMAVFGLPDENGAVRLDPAKLYLALDRIQDPGNLGTIVRMADWFGVDTVLASHDSVDVFNPKTLMATMGSAARVRVVYTDLAATLKEAADTGVALWGTFMDGQSIYGLDDGTPPAGIVVMGNEGRGISEPVSRLLNRRISIPTYPPGHTSAESLNVAMATSIILAEFRRRSLLKINI